VTGGKNRAGNNKVFRLFIAYISPNKCNEVYHDEKPKGSVGPPLCIAALIIRRGIFMTRKWIAIFVILSLVGIVLCSGCTSQPSTPSVTAKPTGSSTQQTQAIGNITVKPTTLVTIPVKGVFVKVSYLGGYNGMYGMNGALQKVKNSGENKPPYEIINATGDVSATFTKEDGSTRHAITVELWKDGKLVKSATNQTPFGTASINYKI
jgi:hypothetical protein